MGKYLDIARQVVDSGQTATIHKWYEERGRHLIYAGNKEVDLPTTNHSLMLNEADVNHGVQTDLDEKGIAKNAREEKRLAREAQNGNGAKTLVKTADDERMAKLYEEVVLGQKPSTPQDVVKLDQIDV